MNIRLRCFFFRWYWLVAMILAMIATVVLFVQNVEKRWEISAAAAGIAASLVYFVQKQKVDEINLFQRLFTEFNNRYAALHRDLQTIYNPSAEDLTTPQRETLDQYFNLCAEEYLFWKEGRILACVWQSWCFGMEYYLSNTRIQSFWSSQQNLNGRNSHYGLTTQAINDGACLRG